MTPVRLEPAASRSRVKHLTTEPLRSLTFVDRTKKLRVRYTSVGSYPDQAALIRAICSGSALFAKVLKGVSIR